MITLTTAHSLDGYRVTKTLEIITAEWALIIDWSTIAKPPQG